MTYNQQDMHIHLRCKRSASLQGIANCGIKQRDWATELLTGLECYPLFMTGVISRHLYYGCKASNLILFFDYLPMDFKC